MRRTAELVHAFPEENTPAGFEPTTYGLKVPEPRQQSSISDEAQCAGDLAAKLAASRGCSRAFSSI
jgi:hypothetical protein